MFLSAKTDLFLGKHCYVAISPDTPVWAESSPASQPGSRLSFENPNAHTNRKKEKKKNIDRCTRCQRSSKRTNNLLRWRDKMHRVCATLTWMYVCFIAVHKTYLCHEGYLWHDLRQVKQKDKTWKRSAKQDNHNLNPALQWNISKWYSAYDLWQTVAFFL